MVPLCCRLGVAPGILVASLALAALPASAQPRKPPAPPTSGQPAPTLVALAPPAADDARAAIAIGPNGEVYAPDGRGAWTRTQRISTSKRLASASRAGAAIVAAGEGVVYRLAENGWSAIRLHQKDRALMSVGPRAIAAVGRQLFVLDQATAGEPTKLAAAPSNVLAIGAGDTVVVQTDKGLFRVQGTRLVAIKQAPKAARLVGDRWALVDGGVIDLTTGKKQGLPAAKTILAASMMTDQRLAIVVQQSGKRELVIVARDKVTRAAIELATSAAPVGVVVDKAGRAVIALADGALLVRDGNAWTQARVTDALPSAKPGAPPARSP